MGRKCLPFVFSIWSVTLTFNDEFTEYYECLDYLLRKNYEELSLNTKRSIANMICNMDLKPLPFSCSLESSLPVNQASSECGLSCLVHPNCVQILLVFPNSCLFPLPAPLSFFFLLVWLYLFTAQFLKSTFIWLPWQSNTLIFLFPKKLWNIIAIIIYIPITSQWQIPYFKFNHLLLVLFCHGPFAMVLNAPCSTAPCPLPVLHFDLVCFFNCSSLNSLLHTFCLWVLFCSLYTDCLHWS